jgi:hypothetical protein
MVRFTHRPLNPEGTTPGTHSVGGWVGLRTYLDGIKKYEKSLVPVGNRDPNRQSSSLRLVTTTAKILVGICEKKHSLHYINPND